MSNQVTYTDNTTWDNLRIFWVLLRRDLKILRPKLPSRFIDTGAQIVTQIILIGLLLPVLGVPHSFIAPVMIGSQLLTFLVLFFNLALNLVLDMQFNRFIDYHITLPIPKRWLFAKYITYFVIEAAIIGIPAMALSIVALRNWIDFTHTQWFLFGLVYIIGLVVWATFFLSAAFTYDFMWFRQNMWVRRNAPIFATSCNLCTWMTAYAFSPKVSLLLLLNPATHNIEALRATLLNPADYLPIMLSIPVMFVWIGINIWRLARGVHKQLDPV